MKKFLINICAILMVISCLMMFACDNSQPQAKEPPAKFTDSAKIEYTLQKDRTYAVTRYTGSGGDIAILDNIEGVSVTAINHSVFKNKGSIKNVTLPSTIKNIGEEAFYYCYGLKTINLEHVTHIEDSAFAYCGQLTNLALDSLVIADAKAFYNCSKLSNVTIGNDCIRLCFDTFANCSANGSLTLGTIDKAWYYYLVSVVSGSTNDLQKNDQIRGENYHLISPDSSLSGFGEKLNNPTKCWEFLTGSHNAGCYLATAEYFTEVLNYNEQHKDVEGKDIAIDEDIDKVFNPEAPRHITKWKTLVTQG